MNEIEKDDYIKQLEDIVGAFFRSATFSFNGVLDDIDTQEFVDAVAQAESVTEKLFKDGRLFPTGDPCH